MKKTILAISFLACTTCFAEPQDNFKESYSYYGLGGLLPTVSIGHRTKIGYNDAFDISLSLSTIVVVTAAHAHASYLYYHTPNDYLGVGAIFSVADGQHRSVTAFCPKFTRGWETENTFKEINIGFPQYTSVGKTYVPWISFNYGWKF